MVNDAFKITTDLVWVFLHILKDAVQCPCHFLMSDDLY